MPIVTLSSGQWAGWAFAWLGTYLVHGTVLLGSAWAVSLVVRSPGVRDALWKTALAGALATTTLSVATSPATPAPDISRRQLVADAMAPALPLALPPAPRLAPPWLPAAAVSLWLLGALAGLARLEVGRRRYWRAAGPRHAVADPDVAGALRRLRERAGVRRTIYLTAADGLLAPAAIGRAEICLPAAALEALTPAQRESVLAHELGHLARRDPLWKVAVEMASAVFWFQPLLHVARRQMVECAELLCDGYAIRVTGRRRPLVESLGVLAASFRPCGVAAAGFGDHGSPLLRRAARVMDATRAPARPLSAPLRAALAVVALVSTVAFAPGVVPPPLQARKLAIRALTIARAELAPGRSGVARVAPGGFLRLAEERDGVRRELVVRPAANGEPVYDYRENGMQRPFDAEVQRWLAESLNEARRR
jgi:beta-lactamase regulating signal transducer with metallopeptidase domain